MQKDPDKMILRRNLFTISSWKMSFICKGGRSSREGEKGMCFDSCARDRTRLSSHFR